MTICEASMKACLAVELVRQTQADKVCDHLGDGRNPTSNIKLLEKNTSVVTECDMTEKGTGKKCYPRQQSIAKRGARGVSHTQSQFCKQTPN